MWKRGVKVKGKAASHYWTSVEQHVPELLNLVENMEDAPFSEGNSILWGKTDWGMAVYAAAREAYELACPHETPRQVKAYVLGLKTLFKTSDKEANEQPIETEEQNA